MYPITEFESVKNTVLATYWPHTLVIRCCTAILYSLSETAPPLPKLQKKPTARRYVGPMQFYLNYYGAGVGRIEVAVALAEDISVGFASVKKVRGYV
jgi:hypothetical protein